MEFNSEKRILVKQILEIELRCAATVVLTFGVIEYRNVDDVC